jgi:5-formyltetrahydrofolate cyclo-ligase
MDNTLMKELQRKEALARRNFLSLTFRKTRSDYICGLIMQIPEYKSASTVMLYRDIFTEVMLDRLWSDALKAGKKVCFPKCIDSTDMKALAPQSVNDFIKGRNNIFEPDPEKSAEVDPLDIDFIVVPCVGFDENRNRIGYGGGYYDRFLPKCKNAHLITVAFETQKIKEGCASTGFDVPIEKVVTELKSY